MKKIVVTSMVLLALVTPNYFFGYFSIEAVEEKQPLSLKEQAIAKLGKTISEEHLAQLKVSASPEIFEFVFKKALLQAAITEPNIWDAADKIKELAATFHEKEILNDPEMAGELILALADKFDVDFKKIIAKGMNPSITEAEATVGTRHILFNPESYINFAAEVLDTPGARQWVKDHPLGFIAKVNPTNPFPKQK